MMTRNTTLSLLLGTFSVIAVGCGGSSSPRLTGAAGKDGGAGTGAAGTGTAGTGAAGTGAAGDGTAGTIAPQAGTTGNPDAAPDSSIDTAPDTVVVVTRPDGSQNYIDTFDMAGDVATWKYTVYGSTGPHTTGDPTNLATQSTIAWDSADDADAKTTSGSLKGTVPFKHESDQIDFQAFSVGAGMFDWTGYKITAKVKIVSGGNLTPGCPLQGWLYISEATDYITHNEPPTDLVVGQWVTLTLDPTNSGINYTSVSQMGIEVNTGGACVGTTPDGGTDASADGGVDAVTDGGADAAKDSSVADASTVDASDGGTTDAVVDGAVIDADSGTIDTAADAVVTPPPPVTATTTVILIDDVMVTVK